MGKRLCGLLMVILIIKRTEKVKACLHRREAGSNMSRQLCREKMSKTVKKTERVMGLAAM